MATNAPVYVPAATESPPAVPNMADVPNMASWRIPNMDFGSIQLQQGAKMKHSQTPCFSIIKFLYALQYCAKNGSHAIKLFGAGFRTLQL